MPSSPWPRRRSRPPPHDSLTVAGFTVGATPTAVPVSAVPRLTGAAADAGVTIEEA